MDILQINKYFKLLLSNLAMFIISFISSCFAMKNRKKLSPKLNVNESNQTKEEIKDEITEDKELLQDNKKSTITMIRVLRCKKV